MSLYHHSGQDPRRDYQSKTRNAGDDAIDLFPNPVPVVQGDGGTCLWVTDDDEVLTDTEPEWGLYNAKIAADYDEHLARLADEDTERRRREGTSR